MASYMRAAIALLAALAGPALEAGPATAQDGPCDDPLVMGWEHRPPFQVRAPDGPEGLDIALIEAIADEMGCAVRFERASWAENLAGVESGRLDLATQATYTEARAAYARYSDRYFDETMVLFAPVDRTGRHDSLDAFLNAGYRVARAEGWTFGAETDSLLAEYAEQDQVITEPTLRAALTAVTEQRADGVLGRRLMVPHMAEARNMAQPLRPLDVVQQTPVHVIFSRAAVPEATVTAFNDAMAELRESGRFEDIVLRHAR